MQIHVYISLPSKVVKGVSVREYVHFFISFGVGDVITFQNKFARERMGKHQYFPELYYVSSFTLIHSVGRSSRKTRTQMLTHFFNFFFLFFF